MMSMRRFWILAGMMWAVAATVMAPSNAQPVNVQAAGLNLTARAPDLAPIPTRLQYGVVSVRNMGPAASAPSVVTINCKKTGRRGGCVDIPAQFAAAYTNPAYPNRIVVNVPALAPGHVHNHTLPFWAGMAWPSGAYQFDFTADAGASNAESNEGNNAGAWTKVVP